MCWLRRWTRVRATFACPLPRPGQRPGAAEPGSGSGRCGGHQPRPTGLSGNPRRRVSSAGAFGTAGADRLQGQFPPPGTLPAVQKPSFRRGALLLDARSAELEQGIGASENLSVTSPPFEAVSCRWSIPGGLWTACSRAGNPPCARPSTPASGTPGVGDCSSKFSFRNLSWAVWDAIRLLPLRQGRCRGAHPFPHPLRFDYFGPRRQPLPAMGPCGKAYDGPASRVAAGELRRYTLESRPAGMGALHLEEYLENHRDVRIQRFT